MSSEGSSSDPRTTSPGFLQLLKQNRNYRHLWCGQVVSEVGDNFNNIAVFALALAYTGSGVVVTGIMLSRAIPAVLAAPVAGVLLDRFDRRHLMIASDLLRGFMALGFLLALSLHQTWMLYVFSGLLMFASPFFTSGRSAILPAIATKEELHTANSLTQTTQWTTLTLGSFLGGESVVYFGYHGAFLLNSLSFFVSAWCVWRLRGHFRVARQEHVAMKHPLREYAEGWQYMRSVPLVLAIGLIGVGWATGGGAASILFPLFGDQVHHRGPAGIGTLWGCAGVGLLVGGVVAHRIGPKLRFAQYKWAVMFAYLIHGGSYILFSQAASFGGALFFMALSRCMVGITSVLNGTKLLQVVPDEFRGRVFATMESLVWGTMMFSMMTAGIASQHVGPRKIGFWAGIASSLTGIFWAYANLTNRLPAPGKKAEVELPDGAEYA